MEILHLNFLLKKLLSWIFSMTLIILYISVTTPFECLGDRTKVDGFSKLYLRFSIVS